MTEQEIYERIVEIIQESRGEGFQVSQTLSLKDDLQADSVDLMEFILTVEDEFGIEISDEDIDELKNVSDVVACVQKNLKEA
ncbi:acyl carrier protein [Streptococcus anginosus]|uniref:Acyl carrier protein n=3 Tax=Streptococcus TaxID=1301 RepID=A0AAP6EN11_STRAP|nr:MULTISPECIES: acyl carrier protein [Streptococcus]AZQ41002.1 acyl carrier protein [Streptococcus periodonticum]MDB8660893.1 acyl carrier protein [Streptococcus anginosus]MDU6600510.1 acyl carrier protein [Streptococcus anginosus]MDX5040474.1 acyl carrier protein [Streptococcus anginosus]OFR42580.1 acyl carrier protein [Streptococcus sp. HMSC071H03]